MCHSGQLTQFPKPCLEHPSRHRFQPAVCGTHPDGLFILSFGPPDKIAVESPNAFERIIKITCKPWALNNNRESLDFIKESTIEIKLEWMSPIVRIKNHRDIKKQFYNHNGVMLNYLTVNKYPVKILADDWKEPKELEAEMNIISPEKTGLLLKEYMVIKDGENETVIYQPDFKALEIKGACVYNVKNCLMTVISQSWGEGWNPILIKEGIYDDRLILVCDTDILKKDSKKQLSDWINEIKIPLEE